MLTAERRDAARYAMAEIRSYAAARNTPRQFEPGTPVVVALAHDPADEVMDRVTKYPPKAVVLAVYFPETERIELITLEPGRRSDDDGDSIRVDGLTEIGMVIDSHRRISMPGQWDEVFVPQRFQDAASRIALPTQGR